MDANCGIKDLQIMNFNNYMRIPWKKQVLKNFLIDSKHVWEEQIFLMKALI
jgi:hypothetical protein